jgi:hypothetical protein
MATPSLIAATQIDTEVALYDLSKYEPIRQASTLRGAPELSGRGVKELPK